MKFDKRKLCVHEARYGEIELEIRELERRRDKLMEEMNGVAGCINSLMITHYYEYLNKFTQHNWWVDDGETLRKVIVFHKGATVYVMVRFEDSWDFFKFFCDSAREFKEALRCRLLHSVGDKAKLVALRKSFGNAKIEKKSVESEDA